MVYAYLVDDILRTTGDDSGERYAVVKYFGETPLGIVFESDDFDKCVEVADDLNRSLSSGDGRLSGKVDVRVGAFFGILSAVSGGFYGGGRSSIKLLNELADNENMKVEEYIADISMKIAKAGVKKLM